MKTKSILLGIVILIVASCSDQADVQINGEEPLPNVMRFKSHEDFMAITKKISTMTEQQLDAGRKKIRLFLTGKF
jgi:hypothetical protein